MSVLVRVTIAVLKLHDLRNLGRKGSIQLMFPNHSSPPKGVRTGTQVDQELGVGADDESMAGCCH